MSDASHPCRDLLRNLLARRSAPVCDMSAAVSDHFFNDSRDEIYFSYPTDASEDAEGRTSRCGGVSSSSDSTAEGPDGAHTAAAWGEGGRRTESHDEATGALERTNTATERRASGVTSRMLKVERHLWRRSGHVFLSNRATADRFTDPREVLGGLLCHGNGNADTATSESPPERHRGESVAAGRADANWRFRLVLSILTCDSVPSCEYDSAVAPVAAPASGESVDGQATQAGAGEAGNLRFVFLNTSQARFVVEVCCERKHVFNFFPSAGTRERLNNGETTAAQRAALARCAMAYGVCEYLVYEHEHRLLSTLSEVTKQLTAFVCECSPPPPAQEAATLSEGTPSQALMREKCYRLVVPVYQVYVGAPDSMDTILSTIFPYTNALLALFTRGKGGGVTAAWEDETGSTTETPDTRAGHALHLSMVALQLLQALAASDTAASDPDGCSEILCELTSQLERASTRDETSQARAAAASLLIAAEEARALIILRRRVRSVTSLPSNPTRVRTFAEASNAVRDSVRFSLRPAALVHCRAGVSRSASLVCLYMMKCLQQHMKCGMRKTRCPPELDTPGDAADADVLLSRDATFPHATTRPVRAVQLEDMLAALQSGRSCVKPNISFALELLVHWKRMTGV